MSQKPNFVYIMTDQLRADWLGCAGHPVVKTPNIDALAQQGTRFTDFHAASPVCMPNRASFLTGRMPTVHGLRYNGCTLSRKANTFVDVLLAAGYDTATIGKSHLEYFQTVATRLQSDGKERLIEEAWKDITHISAEDPANFENEDRYEAPSPYFGFIHVDFASQHGDRLGGHYEQWFKANVENWEELWDDANELPHNYTCPQARRTPIPEELYPTAYIADRAIDYLNEPDRDAAPFFAFVSFPDPHHPFNPPGKYWDMYSPDQFEVSLPYEAHKNPTPPMQWMFEAAKSGGKAITPQTARVIDDQSVREAMALTAGMITMIDDHVGRIVETLKANGQFENTVICFNSDHGDYLGDFNLLLKGGLQMDSISRVPMIWSDPSSRNERTTSTMASTIDIGPTILDRAGLTPYYGVQGKSFLSSLEDDVPHRDSVLIEFNDPAPRAGFKTDVKVRTVRTPDWRLTTYLGEGFDELYDLTTDPKETHNLWDSPDHLAIKAELLLTLSRHLSGQMDECPRSIRIA